MPKVSFIILNFNSSELTLDCIRSIKEHVRCTYEIIVVDNSSTEADYENISVSPVTDGCILLKSRINGGFGAGNMIGAQAANGSYYCFINSDVVFVEDSVSPLIEYLEEHKDCGCITPQQKSFDDKFVPSFKHSCGIRHETIGDPIFEFLSPQKFPARKKEKQNPFIVSQINGCYMFFPAHLFWKIGGFDTNIFLYYEEYDICRRLRNAGYSSVVFPSVCFKHLGGGATKEDIPKSIKKELYISRIYVYAKHHHVIYTSLFRIILLIKSLFVPKKWFLLPMLLNGESLAHSMKHYNLMKK